MTTAMTDECVLDFESIDIKIESNVGSNQLVCNESPYTLSLRQKEFADDKEYNKFVRCCKRMIRTSIEYKQWTEYLKDILGFYSCSITGELNSQTTIEIHHHPIPLEMIIKGILNKQIEKDKEVCTFDISIMTIEAHYKNKIGYIPLVSSLHEKYHNGFLNIPMELISGNYSKYMAEYGSYLEDEDVELIQERMSINKGNCGWGESYRWVKNAID